MGRTEHEKKWQRQHGRVVRTLLLPSLYNRTQFLEIPERLWKSQAAEQCCFEAHWKRLDVSNGMWNWVFHSGGCCTQQKPTRLRYIEPILLASEWWSKPIQADADLVFQLFNIFQINIEIERDTHLLHYVGTGRVKITLWSWGVVASCIWLHE